MAAPQARRNVSRQSIVSAVAISVLMTSAATSHAQPAACVKNFRPRAELRTWGANSDDALTQELLVACPSSSLARVLRAYVLLNRGNKADALRLLVQASAADHDWDERTSKFAGILAEVLRQHRPTVLPTVPQESTGAATASSGTPTETGTPGFVSGAAATPLTMQQIAQIPETSAPAILVGGAWDPTIAGIVNAWWDLTLAIPSAVSGQLGGGVIPIPGVTAPGAGGGVIWIPGVTDTQPLPQTGTTWRDGPLHVVGSSSSSGFGAGASEMPDSIPGFIVNGSAHTMLVVSSGKIYRLPTCFKTPLWADADGVRSEDGAPISYHSSWWKVRGTFVAHVNDGPDGIPFIWGTACPGLGCLKKQDDEFGVLQAGNSDGWAQRYCGGASRSAETRPPIGLNQRITESSCGRPKGFCCFERQGGIWRPKGNGCKSGSCSNMRCP